MNNYRVFETDEFRSRLDRLDSEQKRFVESKLKKYVYPQIKEQPYYGTNIKELQGFTPETWRYRIGQFRLFYGIDENKRIVSIVTIDYRKDAYK
ncbi:MAG: type II toxin-antitoxin system RelE/ParE family toxin [Lentisphaerota bacterium]